MKTPAFHGVPVLFLPFTWLLGCVRSYPKRIENRLIRLSVPKESLGHLLGDVDALSTPLSGELERATVFGPEVRTGKPNSRRSGD